MTNSGTDASAWPARLFAAASVLLVLGFLLAIAFQDGRPRGTGPDRSTTQESDPIAIAGVAAWPVGQPDPPSARYVSMAPSFTEALIYLGAASRIVAVTDYCEGVAPDVPRIGSLFKPNFERIVALAPDRVFGIASAGQSAVFEAMRKRGLTVEVFDGDHIAGVRAMVTRLAELTDARAAAKRFSTELDQRLARRPRPHPPSVLFVVDRQRGIYAAGPDSFVDELIRAAGGQNALTPPGEASTFADGRAWVPIDLEQLAALDVALIVDSSAGANPADAQFAAYWRNVLPYLDVSLDRIVPFERVRAGVRLVAQIDALRTWLDAIGGR